MEETTPSPTPIPLDQEPESSLQIYREVFDLCDHDGNGFITKEELSHICHQVSDEEVASSVLDNVMTCLDSDHDGHISFEEFKAGFETFQQLQAEGAVGGSNSTPAKATEEVYESDPVPDQDEAAWMEVADRIDPQGALAGTGVGAVWKELNHRDPALLENFEGFLSEVISELRQSDMERSTMQMHVRRILEQHSREVSEMDHLLQEELQLAKANHQQNNASQTSRLSSHYSSLLAQREAVIEELATHESDLKHALQEKAQKENELKQDKTLLLTANKALQEQLNTTLRSDSGSGLSCTAVEEGEGSETKETVDPPPSLMAVGEEEDSREVGMSVEEEDPLLASLSDTTPRLNGMQEAVGQELQNQVKSFSPSRSEVTGHMKAESAPVHGSPPTGRHGPEGREASQGTPETSRGSTTSSLGDSSGESTQGTSTMSEESTEALQDHRTAPPTLSGHLGSVSTASLKTTAGLGTLAWTQSQPVPPEAADSAYDMLGVMPRRNQMPSPSSAAANPLNRVFKVIFLGESGVGKSSLIGFLSSGIFPTNVKTTVGLDYSVKTLRIEDETVVFQLWDTAGQERFNNALTPVYFRRADAFVIVYDVTDIRTFKATKKWVSVIRASLREQPSVIMLVGNKSDCAPHQRCVALEDGRNLALELQALFSETSALSGDNVLQAHSTLAKLLLARENADLKEIKKRASETTGSSKCSC